MARVTIEDLLAAESDVLKRIAADIEGESGGSRSMAGHFSNSSGHTSSGSHSSHSSGVTSATVPPAEGQTD